MIKALFPIIGLVMGIDVVFCLDKGFFTPKTFIGKPNNIFKLLGANEETLYASTETGRLYSYTYWKASSEPEKTSKEDRDNNFQSEPNSSSSYFTSPPLFRRVKQIYEIKIHPTIESGGVVKFYLIRLLVV